jgi:hypothetical protein
MSGATTLEGDSQTRSVPNSKEMHDAELAMAKPSRPTFWQHLNTDLDPAQATGPLSAFCFMTGFMCVPMLNGQARVLTLILVTRYHSVRFLCGAGSRRAILRRCAFFLTLSRVFLGQLLVLLSSNRVSTVSRTCVDRDCVSS